MEEKLRKENGREIKKEIEEKIVLSYDIKRKKNIKKIRRYRKKKNWKNEKIFFWFVLFFGLVCFVLILYKKNRGITK